MLYVCFLYMEIGCINIFRSKCSLVTDLLFMKGVSTKPVEFPELSITVDLPVAVKYNKVAVRTLHTYWFYISNSSNMCDWFLLKICLIDFCLRFIRIMRLSDSNTSILAFKTYIYLWDIWKLFYLLVVHSLSHKFRVNINLTFQRIKCL